MRLLSAYDDLLERTMRGVAGTLSKVQFLSGIRSSGEDYRHWGLERTYGKESAQTALRKTHTEAFVAELSTPVSQLWKELVSAAESQGVEQAEYAQSLLDLIGNVPHDLGGGSEEHHQYVLKSLSFLAQTRGPASRLAA
jgi:hypothetical protein